MASLFIACQLFAFHLQGMSVTESEGGSEGGSEGDGGKYSQYSAAGCAQENCARFFTRAKMFVF